MKLIIALIVAFSLPLFAQSAPKYTVVNFESRQDQYSFIGCKIRTDGWDKQEIQNYISVAPGMKYAWRVYFSLGDSKCNDLIIKSETYGRLKPSRGL